MSSITDLVARYESALTSSVGEKGIEQSRLVDALLLRDDLDAAASLGAEDFLRIQGLDEKLRFFAPRIVREIPGQLTLWRNTAGKRSASWWWNLEALVAAPRSGFWPLATAAAATGALALLTTIVSRFFDGGPDTLGAFAVAIQAVLTILAGAGAADFAAQKIDSLLARHRLPPHRLGRARFLFALAVLGIVLVMRLTLPGIAIAYNNWGVAAMKRQDFARAIENYNRAIALNPDFAAAQYNLADAYEQSLDYDKAIASYQTAIRNQSNVEFAYNNLARLLILAKQNYVGAIQLLDSALALKPTDSEVRFRIYKNLGWANFGLKNYSEAAANLAQASRLNPNSAAPHCLLAQVQQAQGSALEPMKEECARCLQMQQDGVEPFWRSFASEQMDKK